MQRVFLILWTIIVLISGAHSVPPGQPPPMPGLYQPRWPLETLPSPVQQREQQRELPGREWRRPALGLAATALGF
jgi:hypothetical protein